MRKTKRIIAAVTAAIITATSTSLMSVCAEDNGGSDFGFVSKNTTNKSDNIEAAESDAQLYDKLGQLLKQGDSLKYGEALYTTGTPDGEKWTKEFYKQRVEFFGEDLLSKYIVDGEFLRESVESDMKGLLNKTENELNKYVDVINDYLISNSIAGSAYAIKKDGVDKLLITYDGNLEKIKAYIAEKGIDEDLVVYEQGQDMIVTQPATTIAVTGTKPDTTITMPVVDDTILYIRVVTVTIIDISGDTLLVKPVDGSLELKSSSKFALSVKQLPADIKPKAGMKLEIMYNGGILETYPAKFGNVQKVVEVKEDTVKEDPTLLKGTKDMTLNDVMSLAELGDELDWADFRDYNGKDVGSGQYIWEYKLEDDYVLRVIGVTDKKPDYILLSRNNEKGIDIRTENVKEYIASSATPVVDDTTIQTTSDTTIKEETFLNVDMYIRQYMNVNNIDGYSYFTEGNSSYVIVCKTNEGISQVKAFVKEKGYNADRIEYKLLDLEINAPEKVPEELDGLSSLIADFMKNNGISGTSEVYSDVVRVVLDRMNDQNGRTLAYFMEQCGIDKRKVIIDAVTFDNSGGQNDGQTSGNLPGDTNCDGDVTLGDALAILQYIANDEKYPLSSKGLLNADCVDLGGGITGLDAIAIQLIDTKLINKEDLPLTSEQLQACLKSRSDNTEKTLGLDDTMTLQTPTASNSYLYDSYNALSDALTKTDSPIIADSNNYGEIFNKTVSAFENKAIDLYVPAVDGNDCELRNKEGFSNISLMTAELYNLPWIWYHCKVNDADVDVKLSYHSVIESSELNSAKTYYEVLKLIAPDAPNPDNYVKFESYQKIYESEITLANDNKVVAMISELTSSSNVYVMFIYEGKLVSVYADKDALSESFWSSFSLEKYDN